MSAAAEATVKADMSPYAIEVRDVYKSFNGFQVLKGINIKVRRGKTRVILGPSGSGKTVIMKHMIGLLKPDRGEIIVDGQDIAKLDSEQLLVVRRKFGMVFQQAALFDSMNVGENVAFPLKEHTKMTADAMADVVRQKLAVVDLKNIEHKFPSELSGGMRKRVGLARAIVLEPSIVLYDEPTTGLDPLTTDSVDKMIMDASKRLEVTSVVISHDVGSALLVADDIAVIHEGVIVEDCPASEIKNSQHPFVKEYLHTWFRKQ